MTTEILVLILLAAVSLAFIAGVFYGSITERRANDEAVDRFLNDIIGETEEASRVLDLRS